MPQNLFSDPNLGRASVGDAARSFLSRLCPTDAIVGQGVAMRKNEVHLQCAKRDDNELHFGKIKPFPTSGGAAAGQRLSGCR